MTDFKSFVERLQATRAKQKSDPVAADRERRAREFSETVDFVRSPSDPAKATAEAIVKAAKIRDAGGRELPTPTGTAAAIIAAGKKRRNEEG